MDVTDFVLGQQKWKGLNNLSKSLPVLFSMILYFREQERANYVVKDYNGVQCTERINLLLTKFWYLTELKGLSLQANYMYLANKDLTVFFFFF